jgi:hypothetical protein
MSKRWWACLISETRRPAASGAESVLQQRGLARAGPAGESEYFHSPRPNPFRMQAAPSAPARSRRPGCGNWSSGPATGAPRPVAHARCRHSCAESSLSSTGASPSFQRARRRRHQRLGDVVAGQHLVEHALGDLVAAIGGLRTVTRRRLEEERLRRAHRSSACAGRTSSVRGILCASVARVSASTPHASRASSHKRHQVALVGIQGMRLRMRRDQRRIG